MTETWHYLRTDAGWEIRDENALLVAFVPDVLHDREDDARMIANALQRSERPRE